MWATIPLLLNIGINPSGLLQVPVVLGATTTTTTTGQ
jgi:hypothetical protein